MNNSTVQSKAKRFKHFIFGICLIVTVAYWLILYFRLQLFELLPHWFWMRTFLTCPLRWLIIPIVFLHLAALWVVCKSPLNKKIRSSLLLTIEFDIKPLSSIISLTTDSAKQFIVHGSCF